MAAKDKFKQLVYGKNIRQDNRTYPPTISTVNTAFDPQAGCASISADAAYNPGTAYAAGDVLFYTDGATVYNSANAVMGGGTVGGLGGDGKNAQSTFIVKSPTTHYWWIFSHDVANNKVWVATVKMDDNGGLGSVSQKATSQTFAGSATDRMAPYYDGTASQYGFIIHLTGSDRWVSYRVNGLSGQNPTFAAAVTTSIGTSYNNNDAANHATVKFNKDNTKFATVYQANIGTAGSPVTGAVVEVFDFNTSTQVPSNFGQFILPINDAGAIAIGGGAQRLKGYDLEWDFDTASPTLYAPVYDPINGMGIRYYVLNASNVPSSSGDVAKSFQSTGTWGDRTIWSLFRDPYDDKIYVATPNKIGSTGGYSANYNDTYGITQVSAITNSSSPAGTAEFVDSVVTTGTKLVRKGLGTRAIRDEASASSGKYNLTPCDTFKEYVLDSDGFIWSIDGALDATKIADVSSITNRKNIAVQKETGFIYLLAGTGATQAIYKVDPISGSVASGVAISGAGITGFNSICSKDGDALKLYAVIEIAGPHYNYAEIVIATGVATKTAGNTSHVAVDTAYIGTTLYMASGDDLYKNTGPGTWATVGANGLSTNYEGLATDDTTLYGYIAGKRYTINTTSGAATLGKSITTNGGTATWNYTITGAGQINYAGTLNPLITSDGTIPPFVGDIIRVENFAGCWTVSTASSGTAQVVGNVLQSYSDCDSCTLVDSNLECKLLVDCCTTGAGIPQKVVGTTDDSTIVVGNVYEITGNATTSDQLNRCVKAVSPDSDLYVTFYNGEVGSIDLTTGIITQNTGLPNTMGITFDSNGNGLTLQEDGKISLVKPSGFANAIEVNASAVSMNKAITVADDGTIYAAGDVSGVTKLQSITYDNNADTITFGSTLVNASVLLTGDMAVGPDTLLYCTGDAAPSGALDPNDLFTLDTTSATNTTIASLTTTLSLTTHQIVKGISFVKDVCKVLVWDSASNGLTLFDVNHLSGVLISSLSLQHPDGSSAFEIPPTSIAYNNPCKYHTESSFKVTSYGNCSDCAASDTSKKCKYKLINCKNGLVKYTEVDLSADVGKIISLNEVGLYKCYTVEHTYSDSVTADVTKLAGYTDCTDCENSENSIFRLLKCTDETSDPKYTTEDLTPGISGYVGKVAILEGEYYGRIVDSLGTSAHSLLTTAVTIVNHTSKCSDANFYTRITACNDSTRIIDIDYTLSPSIHSYIGTSKGLAINNLGNKEDEVCWTAASWIEGPTPYVYQNITVTAFADDCDTCVQTALAPPPSQIALSSCCNTPSGDYAPDFYFAVTAGVDINLDDDGLIVEADITDPTTGILYNGCWNVDELPGLMDPSFLTDWDYINVLASTVVGGSPGTSCHGCTYWCTATAGCEVLACVSSAQDYFVECGGFSQAEQGAGVLAFDEDPLRECFRLCNNKFNGVHGINWYWGNGAGLKWELLGTPYATFDGNSQMGMGIIGMPGDYGYTRFGSAVHCVAENITIGTKDYVKGDILFYTDGHHVFNSNHVFMDNGTNLAGGDMVSPISDINSAYDNYRMATQQAIIVPDPQGGFIGNSTKTHAWYYIFYQSTGDGPFYSAKVLMDTFNGLGLVAPDTIDYKIHDNSTERLCVSTGRTDDAEEVYWVIEVQPWYDIPNPDFGTPLAEPNATIRVHKVSAIGFEVDYTIFELDQNNIQGKLDNFQQMSVCARIKMSPDNKWIVLTGWQGGANWTQLLRFDETTGEIGPTYGEIWTDAPNLGCVPVTTGCNTNIATSFIPTMTAVEFDAGSNYLYMIRSGSIYPPEVPSGSCEGQNTMQPALLRRSLDGVTGEIGEIEIVENNIQFLPGINNIPAMDTEGQGEGCANHAAIPVDMVIGPDWNLYYGMFKGKLTGSQNTGLSSWKQGSFIGQDFNDGEFSTYDKYIGRVVNPHNDYPIVLSPNEDQWDQTYVSLENRRMATGFPVYLKKKCALPSEDDTVYDVGVAATYEACDESTDCGIVIPPIPAYQLTECGCSGADGIGCGGAITDPCYTCDKDYDGIQQTTGLEAPTSNIVANPTVGNAKWSTLETGTNSRHWTVIREAVELLATGVDQTVTLSYSYCKGGTSFHGGQVLQTFEQGPATSRTTGISNYTGVAFDYVYAITEIQFKAEIAYCFQIMKELFESVFNKSCGYGANLCLNFVPANAPGLAPGSAALGNEVWDGVTGTGIVNEDELLNNPVGSPQGTPFDDSAGTSGISNIGDIRIGMSANSPSPAGALGRGGSPSPNSVPGLSRDTGCYFGNCNTQNPARMYSLIWLEGNTEWRMRTQPYDETIGNLINNSGESKNYEIVRIMAHEIFHALGMGHCWRTFRTQGVVDGFNCANVINSPCTSPGIQGNGACAGWWAYYCGVLETNSIMAATVGSDMEWNDFFGTPSCNLAGGDSGLIDRTSVCALYGYTYGNSPYSEAGTTYNQITNSVIAQAQGASTTGLADEDNDVWQCPACEGGLFYTTAAEFEPFVGGTILWNPGDGLGERCFEVSAIDGIPEGETDTTITGYEGPYEDCDECLLTQLSPPCWQLSLCMQCEANVDGSTPMNIITTTDMSSYCVIGGIPGDDVNTPVVVLEEYPNACWTVECALSIDLDEALCQTAAPVTVESSHADCQICCDGVGGQCFSLHSCTTGETFITFTNLFIYIGQVVTLTQYVPGMTPGDCFTVSLCGPCGPDCLGLGAVTVNETWNDCKSCVTEGQQIYDLFDCATCFEEDYWSYPNPIPAGCNYVLGVAETVAISILNGMGGSAYFTGDPAVEDSEGNPFCMKVFPSEMNWSPYAVDVTQSCICNPDEPTPVIGCMDSTALNYNPNANTPCDGTNGNPVIIPCQEDQTIQTNPLGCCCIYIDDTEYEGCCDQTAVNYCPGCSNCCPDNSCCQYNPPPPLISVQYEEDCINCLSWDEIDDVFQKAAKMCDVCWPPPGITYKEYYCNEPLPVVPDPLDPPIIGCLDPVAWNYNPDAELPCDGCCEYVDGCTDQSACNYDPEATETNLDACIYPNECGSCIGDLSCLEPGCMDPTACNYDPNAQEDCVTCCEYSTCVGCCDENDPNYCPTCTVCNSNYCVAGIFDCLSNRDIYVFYDMTSMGYVGAGTTQDDRLLFVNGIKDTMDEVYMWLVNGGYLGNVYHLPVQHVSCAVNGTGICGGTAQDYSTWIPTATASANFERYLRWFTYPAHGNKGANSGDLPDSDRVSFVTLSKCNPGAPNAGQPTDYCFNNITYNTGVGGTTAPIIKQISAKYTWDGISDFESGLPQPQLDPNGHGAADGPGCEGLYDPYHEFAPEKPVDNSPICIAFIDESGQQGAAGTPVSNTDDTINIGQYTSQELISSALAGQGDGCLVTDLNYTLGAGAANTFPYTGDHGIGLGCHSDTASDASGYLNPANNVTQEYKWDFMDFDKFWSLGYDDTTFTFNTVGNENGYAQNNANFLIIPAAAQWQGMTDSNQLILIHHLNQAIGRGVPTLSGHIEVANFVEWPVYVGTSNNTRHSARYMTDPLMVNKYAGGQQGFAIQSEPNNMLGNYKFNYSLPNEVTSLGQVGSDAMLFLLLEGLCANYMEMGAVQ